ncbi:MAG: 3-deoxy-7-phosphoheptulonate synthase [Acidimicrobiia bacterium]|nr:3-deoxy-7-phosphoheptulonate synthase [Acidimicrobiia bacterium]
MRDRIENSRLTAFQPLDAPARVKDAVPLTRDAEQLVLATRAAIRDVIHGRDTRRLVVVVGPCSIHDPAAAYEYADRLGGVREDVSDRLIVVMRTYFEKPRTTVGWKGLVNDPHLDGTGDIQAGLRLAREILAHVSDQGVPCATELLDPITPQYISDMLSWTAVGARTTESQTHREMASGLSMPVGFKNGTDGTLEGARNAMTSAASPHSFLGINAEGVTSIVKTTGNPDRHVVLRGGRDGTNYAPADIAAAVELVSSEGIARPIMVDTSHDNSGKDHTRQAEVCRSVVEQFVGGQSAIMGTMIESNLEPGNQAWRPGAALRYGLSITDACIGWDETATLLKEIAAAV